MIWLIALAACGATLAGGFFALRLKDRLHLILGFSAGTVLGVAFFDLLPEAFALSTPDTNSRMLLSITALGFLIYLILDRFVLLHTHADEDEHAHGHARGPVGAGSLSIHSFLDGVGIGLAFKVSPAIGLVVALAVLAHDFSDGVNTVSMILKNGGSRRLASKWLLVDAIAPFLGIAATSLVSVSENALGFLLALFAGFFLYIGASDLLPESHHAHPKRWTTISTIFGIGLMYAIIHMSIL